jgi:hypothetical protein
MSGSLGKSFERSFRGPGDKDEEKKKRLSFRVSEYCIIWGQSPSTN